jgi:hypothetical protein
MLSRPKACDWNEAGFSFLDIPFIAVFRGSMPVEAFSHSNYDAHDGKQDDV